MRPRTGSRSPRVGSDFDLGRAGQAIAAALIFAIAAGCTSGFWYDRLDWFVSWYINGLVTLDADQEGRLQASLRSTLEWHRRTQMPKYAALLEEISGDLQTPVTAAYLERRYQQMTAMVDESIGHVVTDAAGLLTTLRAEQITELAASLQEDNEDLWDAYSGTTPEVREKRRVKNMRRFVQRYVGRLSSEQRATMDSRLAGMHDNTEAWLERRRHWQSRFLALLRTHPPRAEFDAALRDLALNPNQFDSAEYRRDVQENRQLVMSMLAELTSGLSVRQREHLSRTLGEYASDFRETSERD